MKKVIWVLVLFHFLISPQLIHAANDGVLGLDDTLAYDIYLRGVASSAPVIKAVQLVDTRVINNYVYLVVRSDRFFSKKTDGLIRLEDIQAILPTFTSPGVQTRP